MSIYSKLSALLTAANTKTGESDTTLTDAVQTLIDGYGQGGGGDKALEASLIDGTITGTYENDDVITVVSSGLVRRQFSGVSFPNCTTINDSSFRYCSNLVYVSLPKLTSVTGQSANYGFGNCSNLEVIALPSLNSRLRMTFYSCAKLATADVGSCEGLYNQTFYGTILNVLVIRTSTVCVLDNINVFNSSPFASNGAGGTVYVPQSLISSYQSATNWSTILGYANNSIQKIEGSYYATHYADGTVIPT